MRGVDCVNTEILATLSSSPHTAERSEWKECRAGQIQFLTLSRPRIFSRKNTSRDTFGKSMKMLSRRLVWVAAVGVYIGPDPKHVQINAFRLVWPCARKKDIHPWLFAT